ncbi:MAG: beta-ketoacyl synthase N-terminal-like domain-containing protein [Pirellulales bacterium]
MSFSVVALSPPHRCDPQLAIAASHAGEIGLLDVSHAAPSIAITALDRLHRYAAENSRYGIRFDLFGSVGRLTILGKFITRPLAYLVLAGLTGDIELLSSVRRSCGAFAKQLVLEVHDVAEAELAEQANFDGVVLKGHEAGGRVSPWSSFLFLQKVRGRINLPFWLHGGIGAETAAAARFAGAAGVVLCEQLWLADGCCDPREVDLWRHLDGSETQVIGEDGLLFRFFSRSGRTTLATVAHKTAVHEPWVEDLWQSLSSQSSTPERLEKTWLLPMGQDIAFAAGLAQKYGTVGRILTAIQGASEKCIIQAATQQSLSPESPLAASWRTQYPIAQGPMTRVSDVAGFAACVAEYGALPFLALALLRAPEVRKLLGETKVLLGQRAWGVGILGFVPPELRKEQLSVVLEAKPKFTVIAGGRPSQAADLERAGISTYLHVPSPGLLAAFLRDGSRKFIFEGRECGGHVGPRTSFVLWQSAIDTLLKADLDDLKNIEVLFAGGIHDSVSAAMVATLAAPLVERGVKIGILMGTSYLFTAEAVACGAITREFQEQAIRCERTALLETGPGHSTRCVPTSFVDEFQDKKRELVAAGKEPDQIRLELEMLNVGRLRLASKGLVRQAGNQPAATKGELASVDVESQRRMGMYMIGDVATMRSQTITMRQLHEEVTSGCVDELRRSTWRVESGSATVQTARASEPIAIVGMGCMFPDSPNVRRYWENIFRRFDAIREVPAERWRADDFYSSNRLERDRFYSKWGSFLEEHRFDPVKYRIPPAAIASIEPVQLLALEVAEQALEDAGFRYEGFPREQTAVIFGAAGTHDLGLGYAFRTMMRHHLPKVEGLSEEVREKIYVSLERQLPSWTEDSFAGFLLNVVAGRIANRFDLRGPNFTVDAACASSIAAVQTAVEQLRAGKCDAALVGAVDATNNPFCFMSFAKTHALSPGGKSRPYDRNADGIGLGEGLGAVVLKRLQDATRDGDKIYAVIRGVGSSSDGRNRSMTAPFPDGQVLALRRAYDDASIDPATVTLIEAHSTGTSVGDRVELEALQKIFPDRNGAGRSCAIGSVKSNLGHTKTSAGLASLIKTALALKQRVLPPTIGVQQPNEQFVTAGCPFYVNTDNRPWLVDHSNPKRRAGVSAFGFGGTNFHVVLEECDEANHVDFQPRDAELFVWRSTDWPELLKKLNRLASALTAVPSLDLAQLAYSVSAELRNGDTTGDVRCAVVATSPNDLKEKLKRLIEEAGDHTDVRIASRAWLRAGAASDFSDVCYLFPGQGSQSLNMLKELVLGNDWSYQRFQEADRLLADHFPEKLTTLVYPLSTFSDADRKTLAAELNDTRAAQPALGLLDAFGYELLDRYGVRPAFVAGHSYGEYVALWAAGSITWDDLMRLSAERGRLAHQASQQEAGSMAAVSANAETTARHLRESCIDVELANLNADDQTVIAGAAAAIDSALKRFSAHGIQARKLPVTAAFHTAALQSASDALKECLNAIELTVPRIPVYSNTIADRYPLDPDAVRQILSGHIVKPVRFVDQIKRLHADGAKFFLEVGPGSVLTGLIGRILRDQPHTAISLDGGAGRGWTQFGALLGELFVCGKPVDIDRWFQHRGLRSIGVDEYFQELRTRAAQRPTDWIISPSGGRPVQQAKPQPGKSSDPVASHKSTSTQSGPTNGTQSNPQPVGNAQHGLPAATPTKALAASGSQIPSTLPQLTKGTSMSDTLTRNGTSSRSSSHVPEQANGAPRRAGWATDQNPLSQFQSVMMEWIKLQRGQTKLSERFLDMQESVMRATLGVEFPVRANEANGIVEGATTGAADAAQPLIGLTVAPAPVIPLLPGTVRLTSPADQLRAVVESPDGATQSPNPSWATNDDKVGVNRFESASKHEANGDVSGAPPTTEEFRRDLLDAVSQRTGYPIDMLDENAALEAELGIDSIKTVEIFSSLSKYHALLPGSDDDQDETLSNFAQLKTLRDIINAYERRRTEQLGASPNVDISAQQITADTKGSVQDFDAAAIEGKPIPADSTVERFTLEPAEADLTLEVKKKPSLESTYS